MKLSSAKAVITGGASGLGLAVAKKVISAGGAMAILDCNAERGAATISSLGERAHFFETDVSSEMSVDLAISAAASALQGITLAVNCAGIAPSQRVLGRDRLMSTAEFERVININLIGTFTVCRAVANVMQHNEASEPDGERGVIINTASIAAYEGQIGQTAYAASKGGVLSMTLPLAREFARIGVRVMSIAPGVFETPMYDTLPVEARDTLAANTPFPQRLGQAEEFSNLVASIYENAMLNGSVIRIDGALRMGIK